MSSWAGKRNGGYKFGGFSPSIITEGNIGREADFERGGWRIPPERKGCAKPTPPEGDSH